MGMELKEQTMSFMFLYYKCLKAIIIMPQFRSIIPCEVLLYIEVTFLDLSIDMGIFWGSWFLHSHEIPHPNQWGSMKNHKEILFIP